MINRGIHTILEIEHDKGQNSVAVVSINANVANDIYIEAKDL